MALGYLPAGRTKVRGLDQNWTCTASMCQTDSDLSPSQVHRRESDSHVARDAPHPGDSNVRHPRFSDTNTFGHICHHRTLRVREPGRLVSPRLLAKLPRHLLGLYVRCVGSVGAYQTAELNISDSAANLQAFCLVGGVDRRPVSAKVANTLFLAVGLIGTAVLSVCSSDTNRGGQFYRALTYCTRLWQALEVGARAIASQLFSLSTPSSRATWHR